MNRRSLLRSLPFVAAGAAAAPQADAALPEMKITRVRYYHVGGDTRPIFNQSSEIVTIETDQGLAASSGPCIMEMRGTGQLAAPHLPASYDFRAGKLYPINRPGLGIEFDPSQAELILEVTESHAPIPLNRRPDGSITNW